VLPRPQHPNARVSRHGAVRTAKIEQEIEPIGAKPHER
jgi:hypothetical protein